jgi:hypothetical protein
LNYHQKHPLDNVELSLLKVYLSDRHQISGSFLSNVV